MLSLTIPSKWVVIRDIVGLSFRYLAKASTNFCPSFGLVPLANSSKTTKPVPKSKNIFTSLSFIISAPKVLKPLEISCISSDIKNTKSTSGNFAFSAITKNPIWKSKRFSVIVFNATLFPPIFAPVIMVTPDFNFTSIGVKVLLLASNISLTSIFTSPVTSISLSVDISGLIPP